MTRVPRSYLFCESSRAECSRPALAEQADRVLSRQLRPMSLRNSHSWLASLIETGLAPPSGSSADNKFSTVANGAAGVRRPRAGPSLFGEDGDAGDAADKTVIDEELRDLQGLRESEAGWSVTVAEGAKARSRNRKVSSLARHPVDLD